MGATTTKGVWEEQFENALMTIDCRNNKIHVTSEGKVPATFSFLSEPTIEDYSIIKHQCYKIGLLKEEEL